MTMVLQRCARNCSHSHITVRAEFTDLEAVFHGLSILTFFPTANDEHAILGFSALYVICIKRFDSLAPQFSRGEFE